MRRHIRKVARFDRVRRGYSAIEAVRQRLLQRTSKNGSRPITTLAGSVDPLVISQQLSEFGVVTGLRLKSDLVEEIHAFSRTSRCYDPLRRDTVENVQVAMGERDSVPRVFVRRPQRCDAVQRVVDDAGLRSVAAAYLGYRPNHVESELVWSLAPASATVSYDKLHRYHAARFHFDTHGLNSVQLIFYLTNVDRKSGAHSVLRRSHNSKRLSMKLRSSVRISEAELLEHFGSDSELVIEGGAGDGFVEDPACFHRIIHPVTADRLALQIIYS